MASSIRVVFEVDNKKFIADVKRAEDATTKFAKTTSTSLDSIRPRLAELTGKFAGFAASIAALGLTAAINNAIKYADAINDITDATGIAIDSVMGFSNVVALNGGSAEGAQKAILKLAATIDDAAGGSKQAQMAFIDVGVSLRDLETLSEQDILAKTIEGLAKFGSTSKGVALATQLLGKEFRAVNLANVAAGYSSAVTEAQKYTNAVQQAAAVQGNLDIAFQRIQLSILKAIEPLAEFAASLTPEQIDKMAQGLVDVAKALAGFAAGVTALKGLAAVLGVLGGAFALAKTGMAGITAATAVFGGALASLNRTAVIAAGYIDRFRRGTPMFAAENGAVKNFSTLLDRLAKRLPFLGAGFATAGVATGGFLLGLGRMVPAAASVVAIVYSLNEAIKLFTDSSGITSWGNVFVNTMARAVEGLGSLAAGILNLPTDAFAGLLRLVGVKIDNPFGLGDGLKNVVNQAKLAREEVERIALLDSLNKNRVAVAGPGVDVATGRPDTRAQDALDKEREKRRQIQTDLEKFRQTQVDVLKNYQNANSAITDNISLEQKLIGLSSNEIALLRAKEEILGRQADLVEGLVKEQNKLRLELGTDPTAGAKIAAISDTIAKIKLETVSAQTSIDTFTRSLQAAESVERMRLSVLQQSVDLENLRATVLGYSTTELEKFNQAQRTNADFANKTAAEIEQLRAQAVERDRLTGTLTAERIARETNANLLELETSILGTQFTALQKLEQLKLANQDAFSRKTQDEINALTAQATKIDEVTAKFREQAFARDLLQQGQDFAQGIRDEMTMQLATGEAARRRIQVEIDGRDALRTKIREINQSYGDESRLSESLRQQRAREIADATKGITALQAAKAQAVAEDQAQRDSFEFGWEAAYGKFAEDAKSAAGQANTYFQTFTKGFEDAFVKFVQTGKISFKDLANSLIADFARIQAKQALLGIFGGGGGGGGGGFFGNILGGIGKIFGFANGGMPPVGVPSVVGERGPELFVPQSAGRIIPNHALGMGGQSIINNTTEVTYSIQAVDASSFRTLLARDPEFIHNVAEQGRRQLPIRSRR
jgi:lambda family phage tail tape measure protein